MFTWCIPRYLLFLFLIEHLNTKFANASWPSSNMMNVQLLGLFDDSDNASELNTFGVHSRAMFKAAIILSQQYNMKFEDQFIEGHVVHTYGNRMNAFSGMCEAISALKVVGIVGPAYSRDAHLIGSFAGSIGIPDISYAATDPDLSNRDAYPTFYRTVSSDTASAMAMGKLFVQYNWASTAIIYQNDAFGSGGIKSINQVFSNISVVVRQTIVFDVTTKTIRGDLKSLIASSSTRIIVLWADVINTVSILQFALDNDVLGPQFTWILTSSCSLNSFNQTSLSKLVGMITVEPVVGSAIVAPINTTLLNAAYSTWQQYEPETFPEAANVDYYAVFAFDATWTLILALQQMCSTSRNLPSSCTALINSSSCFDRRFLESRAFLDTINNLTFLGVSGPVQFSVNSTDRIKGTYYVVQNSQFSGNSVSFIPVLKYSDSSNWDVLNNTDGIVWPGNSSVPPSDHIILQGVTVRIALIESVPFTIVTYEIDNKGQSIVKFTGYIPDLIDLLQNKMKFIPQIILIPSNKTYAEVIQDVANGVYDMLVGDVAITAARREIVSFSTGIFDNSINIVMRQPMPDAVDLLSYLRPFTSNLWFLLLGCIIYAGVLASVLERQENDVLKNRSIPSLIFMGLWFAIGVIVGYGVDFHVRTAPGRLLTAGLYIVSIVFVATYTANLASYLTISKSADAVSGIDDIKNGKLTFNRIGIRVGTSMEDYYLREISGGNRNFYPLKSLNEQYASLINGVVDATFMDSGIAEYATNNLYCNLTVIGADFDKASFGIVMPKQWLYVQDIDVAILSLKEKGVLDTLRSQWFGDRICPDAYEIPTAMGIEAMAGLFLTFAVISILAILLSMWTARYIIRDYLLAAAHRKNLLTHIRLSMIRRGSKGY